MKSAYLSKIQIKGLAKVGDIIIPESQLASFSEVLVSEGSIDRILSYINKDDLFGLKILFTLFWIMPLFLLKKVIFLVFNNKDYPKLLFKLTNMLKLGIKGIVLSIYYNKSNTLEMVQDSHQILKFKLSKLEAFKDPEMKEFISTQDFNSNL